ncbi:MAG: DNA polymerase IV [Proteobacteria bacterium]|nr:DNA polymerase IV [Pseudomonadota bacterium]
MSERWPRIVLHADMDAFYAAVEQLDDPSLRGKPLLVGPNSGRGVVLTASYAARPFGVGSAMPMSKAKRLCPQAIVVPPRFDRYSEISKQVMSVFGDFSPDVEPLSLDEAFLEMSGAERIFGGPLEMGRKLKEAVKEATGGLTVSVGVSATKYVAKVASDFRKPDGLTVVHPDEVKDWLAPLSVRALWGVGPKTGERLAALGLDKIGDVAAADFDWLKRVLGDNGGTHLYRLANGQDARRVQRSRRMRSIGSERTLAEDVSDRAVIQEHLRSSAASIGRRLRRKSWLARGVRVKLKTASFQLMTRQRVLDPPTDVGDQLYKAAVPLLDAFEYTEPFRLVGLAAYDLVRPDDPLQLDLFAGGPTKKRKAEETMDSIRERFGKDAVQRAENLGKGSWEGPNLDYQE